MRMDHMSNMPYSHQAAANAGPKYVSPAAANVSPYGSNVSPLGSNVGPLGSNVSPLGGKVGPYSSNVSPLGYKPAYPNVSPAGYYPKRFSAFAGSSLGSILVLFILLVIITRKFKY